MLAGWRDLHFREIVITGYVENLSLEYWTFAFPLKRGSYVFLKIRIHAKICHKLQVVLLWVCLVCWWLLKLADGHKGFLYYSQCCCIFVNFIVTEFKNGPWVSSEEGHLFWHWGSCTPGMGRMWLVQRKPGWNDCDKLSPTFQSWLHWFTFLQNYTGYWTDILSPFYYMGGFKEIKQPIHPKSCCFHMWSQKWSPEDTIVVLCDLKETLF